MPFITEELWQRLAPRQGSIALAEFPAHDPNLVDGQAELQIAALQSIIGPPVRTATTATIDGIRNARSQWGVVAGQKIPVKLATTPDLFDLSSRYQQVIERLANVTLVLEMATTDDIFFGQSGFRIEPLGGVDIAVEQARLRKQEQKLSREISSLKAQLENQQFLSKASPQIVAERRRRIEEVEIEYAKVADSLGKLSPQRGDR